MFTVKVEIPHHSIYQMIILNWVILDASLFLSSTSFGGLRKFLALSIQHEEKFEFLGFFSVVIVRHKLKLYRARRLDS